MSKSLFLRKSLYGFSLIELMVSIALSLFLLSGAVKLLAYCKEAQRAQEAWIKITRQAYYLSLYFYPRLRGVNESLCDKPKDFKRVQFYSANHRPSYINESSNIYGDVVTITRCEKEAKSFKWVTRAYFVAATKRHDQYGKNIYALYEQRLDTNRVELEEGINYLQITLNVLSNKNKLVDLPIRSLSDSSEVKGVNLQFVISATSTLNRILEKPWDIYAGLD